MNKIILIIAAAIYSYGVFLLMDKFGKKIPTVIIIFLSATGIIAFLYAILNDL